MSDIATLEMAAEIVSAYVSYNKVEGGEVPGLIKSVYSSLSTVGQPEVQPDAPSHRVTSAQVKKSITPDALISFVDGKSYKTLKRHLTTNGLTFDAYKSKFGLPHDYPSTAPSYSERRSQMAKALGLGNMGRTGAKQKAPKKARAKAAKA